MSDIKVIGIDPAPSKKSTIYDGEKFEHKDYASLKKYLSEELEKNKKILICWDAPLSFYLNTKSPFTKRVIEKFFTKKITGFKTPKGISIRPYSECSHWTITQYILGYPYIRPIYPASSHSFNLVFEKASINKSVTEVHPALAMWIWGKTNNFEIKNYKKNIDDLDEIIDKLIIINVVDKQIKTKIYEQEVKYQADCLDAYIAWKLGNDWINGTDVEILGGNKTGSFLLPNYPNLKEKFDEFKKQHLSDAL